MNNKKETKEEKNKSVSIAIKKFLDKQESPEKLSENVERFMIQKVLPLYKKKRETFTQENAADFFNILEGEMGKCSDPLHMIRYLSLMSESVNFFDKIFIKEV